MDGFTRRLFLTQRQKTIRNGLFSSQRFPTIYHLPKYIFSLPFQNIFRHVGYENQDINHCDASVSAFQVFDWESFAVTVCHYCLQPKNFDSNIEASIISGTSIYSSFLKDGDDDVDTPCWIKLDVLPALEQGQGNVTQAKNSLVMSLKKVTCNVTQAVESVTFVKLLVPLSLSAFFAQDFLWASKFLRDFVRSTVTLIKRFSW